MKITGLSAAKIIFPAFVFFLISATLFDVVPAREARAETYTNREKIYLKEITPILYELSEVGKSVSRNAVGLQSESAEKCAHEFGYYQEIVESLKVRMSTLAPPQRLLPVKSTALQAIGDYSGGLRTYAQACTESDNDVRSDMVEEARQGLVAAGTKIRRVNELIANPVAVETPAKDTAESKIQRMCMSSWPADEKMQDYCMKNQTEALKKVNKMLQTYPAGTSERNIIQSCGAAWKKGNTYDYRMVVFCVESRLGKVAGP